MRIFQSTVVIVALLLASGTAAADDPVEISIQSGTLNAAGDGADLTFQVVNDTAVPIRLVGMVLEYDTMAGETLLFEYGEDFDLTVAPLVTVTETHHFATHDAAGTYPNFIDPYTMEPILGADVSALGELASSPGENSAEIQRALRQMWFLAAAMRRADRNYSERLSQISDGAAWFDADAVDALRPTAEESLCRAMADRVRRAQTGEQRVDEYRIVHEELLRNNMYADCLGEDIQLLAARSMVRIDRAQDALVMAQRDENGDVTDAWREIYISGRYGLAQDGIAAVTITQFRPAIDSLVELKRYVSERRDYRELRDRLLGAAKVYVNTLIDEQKEMEALDMLVLMQEGFADHPFVIEATDSVAAGVVVFGVRAADNNEPIVANNAYVRGLEHFPGVEVWETQSPRLQEARGVSFLRSARAAVDDGRLTEAEETLDEAQRRRLDLDPAARQAILGDILIARWTEIPTLIEEHEYEAAFHLAVSLEDNELYPAEALGDTRAQTYLDLAAAIWDQYGLFGGAFAGKTMDVAEQALERGRDADPDQADSIQSKIDMSRWLLPVLMLILLVSIGAVLLLKGSWRKNLKAKKLWGAGVRSQKNGDLSTAVDQLDAAYNLIGMSDGAAKVVGEESRGYMVLRIAAIEQKRGQEDEVRLWTGEWKGLDEYERPFDNDFEVALGKYLAS